MSATSHRTWPLPGGIVLETHKAQSLSQKIRKAPLPARLIISLAQPDHAESTLEVSESDYVLKGQVLARSSSTNGVNVIASTSGTILAIGPHAVPNASGFEELCVILQPDGEERWTRLPPITDFMNCSRELLHKRIQDAGIRGFGGAAFPAHAKVTEHTRIHTLVLNACECEPFISCDEALIQEYAAEIIVGTQILLQASGAVRCLIGIEDNKPAAITALREVIADTRLELVVLPTIYPSGAERQLIYSLTGIEIAAQTLPVEKGFLCHNPGTALAVMRAVSLGEAMVSRVTTVTGAAVDAPGNIEVLLGTPVSDLLHLCGLNEHKLDRLISGGPLMGVQLASAETPVSITTNCILATSTAELPAPLAEQPCIRCGFCAPVCPAVLQPQVLYWDIREQAWDDAADHHLFDCIECGACAYVCPSHIPLVQYFRAAKAEIALEAEQLQIADSSRQRFEFHQQRVRAEKLQHDARRAERAALQHKKPDEPVAVTSAQATIAAALARVKAKKLAQSNADSARLNSDKNGKDE